MGYESKVNLSIAFPNAEVADKVWSAYTNDPLYLEYVKEGPLDWERLTHRKGYVCFNYSSDKDLDSNCGWLKWYHSSEDKRTAVYELLEMTAYKMEAPFAFKVMRIGEDIRDCEEECWSSEACQEEEFEGFNDDPCYGLELGGLIYRDFDLIFARDWRAE